MTIRIPAPSGDREKVGLIERPIGLPIRLSIFGPNGRTCHNPSKGGSAEIPQVPAERARQIGACGTAECAARHTGEIYIMNPDGSGKTRLTNSSATGTINWDPSVTQDGKKVIFSVGNPADHTHDVYSMNIDGSNIVRLTTVRYSSVVFTSCAWCKRFTP
jgi:hypothetical protein